MKSSTLFVGSIALFLFVAACGASSTEDGGVGGAAGGTGGSTAAGGATATGGSGGSIGGAAGTGGVSGGAGGVSGGAGGVTAGAGGVTAGAGGVSGGAGGVTAGAGGVTAGAGGATNTDAGNDVSVIPSDGAVQNCVPADYTGTPFKALTIPGKIYLRDYDKGGPSVAFCRTAAATTPAACAQGIKLNDWCCTSVRCDQRGNPVCPIYRTDADNAGLSMMNNGEPDQDAAGKLVFPQEAYISYTLTGEWLKFTVDVIAAGTYTINGMTAAPRIDQDPNPQVRLDFGCGVTSGVFTIPPSICNAGAPCTEGYHVWLNNNNMGEVTFPAPGKYLMTFTLVKSFFNPMYFDFVKK
jgi:hypothetical protein